MEIFFFCSRTCVSFKLQKTLPSWHWWDIGATWYSNAMVLMRHWASDDVAPWSLFKGRLLLQERQIFANFVVARSPTNYVSLSLVFSFGLFRVGNSLSNCTVLKVSLDLVGLAKLDLYLEIIPANHGTDSWPLLITGRRINNWSRGFFSFFQVISMNKWRQMLLN